MRWGSRGTYVYSGVARLPASSTLVSKFDTHGPALMLEWKNCWKDEQWSCFLKYATDARSVAAYYEQNGVLTEVIGATECESPDDDAARAPVGRPLGFDVASLSLESAIYPRPWLDYASLKNREDWEPIWRLQETYVHANLNEHGLLASYAAAEIVKRAVTALNRLYADGFLEDFRVLAVDDVPR